MATIMDGEIFVGFLSLFSVFAILLNAATLIAMLTCPILRKTQNIFTFNVALGDFVASLVVAIQRWLDHWADLYLPSLTRVLGAAMMVSILSTLAVAIHRFIVIRLDPFQNRRLVTGPRCVAACVLIWMAMIAVYMGTYYLNDSLFFYFISPVMLLSTIGVCAICYSVIFVTIYSSTRNIWLTSDAYAQRVKKNKKVLCTFVLIVCSNLVCWIIMCFCMLCLADRPTFIYVYDPLYGRYRTASWFYNMYLVGWWLVNINAIINPVIYWTRLTDFRRLLFNCCCYCCGRGSHQDPGSVVTHESKAENDFDNVKLEVKLADDVTNADPENAYTIFG